MKRRIGSSLALTALLAAVLAPAAWAATQETSYEWSMDLDCALCHQKEAEGLAPAEADKAEGAEAAPAGSGADGKGTGAAQVSAYAAMHAQTFGLECVACHSDEKGLAEGHKNLNSGKEARRLKKSEVGSEACTTCHKAEDLAEKTAEYQGLTDKNGTKYQITGRSSEWGITGKQFAIYAAIGIGAVVLLVSLVMITIHKISKSKAKYAAAAAAEKDEPIDEEALRLEVMQELLDEKKNG